MNSASSWVKEATSVSGTNLPPNLPNFPLVVEGMMKSLFLMEGVGGGTWLIVNSGTLVLKGS